jgi:hypothetical protein
MSIVKEGSGDGIAPFCKHRWVIVKRWTENKVFSAIMRCRWCDDWKRSDIGMNTEPRARKLLALTTYEILDPLENNVPRETIPRPIGSIDPETGEIMDLGV